MNQRRPMRWHPHLTVPLHPLPAVALSTILAAASAGCASTASHAPSGSPPSTGHSSATTSPSFAAFAGHWSGHDSYLDVRSDGGFTLGARTFRVCGQDPPPCDTWSGNTITDGDIATGRLTSLTGEIATGEVTRTTDPADSPAGKITMTLDPATDTLSASNVSFCGPSAPSGTCGA